jgi:hypothetical protein
VLDRCDGSIVAVFRPRVLLDAQLFKGLTALGHCFSTFRRQPTLFDPSRI